MAGYNEFYKGPFYKGENRMERRKMVLHYLPHRYTPSENMRGICRICGFPKIDAPCAQ